MKPLTKRLLYIGAACVIVGLLFVILSFAIGGFRLQALNTGLPYEEKHYTYPSNKVKSLSVNGGFCDIKLIPSAKSEFQITTYENEQVHYEINLSSTGELIIKQIVNARWYDNFGIILSSASERTKNQIFNTRWYNNVIIGDLTDSSIVIEIPEEFIGKIDVLTKSGKINTSELKLGDETVLSTSSGDITVSGLSASKQISINSRSGKIHASELKLNDAVILSTRSGDIRISGLSASNRISINSKSGGIRLDNLSTDSDLEITSSSGDIEASAVNVGGRMLADSKSGSINIEEGTVQRDLSTTSSPGNISIRKIQVAQNILIMSRSGRVSMQETNANGDVTVETRSGSIHFQALCANNISFTSSSGEVNGTIDDATKNYTITYKSKSGDVKLPESGNGGKRLSVTTQSGDIKIRFTK